MMKKGSAPLSIYPAPLDWGVSVCLWESPTIVAFSGDFLLKNPHILSDFHSNVHVLGTSTTPTTMIRIRMYTIWCTVNRTFQRANPATLNILLKWWLLDPQGWEMIFVQTKHWHIWLTVHPNIHRNYIVRYFASKLQRFIWIKVGAKTKIFDGCQLLLPPQTEVELRREKWLPSQPSPPLAMLSHH